jgi:hypothetical protein
MSDQWETFCDVGYYHMWRLRLKTERGWNDGFHINTRDEAQALCQLLNKLEREVERERALANEAIATWKKTREERDQTLSDLEFRRDLFKLQEQQLNDVRAERDRLAEVAQAVWDRWETPLWKDHPPTAFVMNKLRDALTAVEGGPQ